MFSVAAIYRALEKRYDYYSTRIVFREALVWAGLEVKESYQPKEVKALAAAVEALGDRSEAAVTALKTLASAAQSAPGKKPEPAAAEPAAAEPAKVAAEPAKKSAKKSTKKSTKKSKPAAAKKK